MTRPGQPPAPDPFDAGLSAAREAVDYIGVGRAIWDARHEPDAFARRCAADAIDAIDTALASLHRIRAEWVSQIRQADDQAAARVDQLLATMREGPPDTVMARPPDRATTTQCRPATHSGAEVMNSINRGGDTGLAPREAAP
jgi:hypothetical protein